MDLEACVQQPFDDLPLIIEGCKDQQPAVPGDFRHRPFASNTVRVAQDLYIVFVVEANRQWQFDILFHLRGLHDRIQQWRQHWVQSNLLGRFDCRRLVDVKEMHVVVLSKLFECVQERFHVPPFGLVRAVVDSLVRGFVCTRKVHPQAAPGLCLLKQIQASHHLWIVAFLCLLGLKFAPVLDILRSALGATDDDDRLFT